MRMPLTARLSMLAIVFAVTGSSVDVASAAEPADRAAQVTPSTSYRWLA